MGPLGLPELRGNRGSPGPQVRKATRVRKARQDPRARRGLKVTPDPRGRKATRESRDRKASKARKGNKDRLSNLGSGQTARVQGILALTQTAT